MAAKNFIDAMRRSVRDAEEKLRKVELERDAAVEALRIVVESDDRPAQRHAANVLAKIEGGRG